MLKKVGQMGRSFSKHKKLIKIFSVGESSNVDAQTDKVTKVFIPNEIRNWFSAHVGARDKKWEIWGA